MKVAIIFNDPTGTGGFGDPIHYYMQVMKERGVEFQHFWCKDSDQIPKDFDLYFRYDHGDYKDDIPEDLQPAVWYVIDTHLKKPYKKIKKQVKHYDIIFCAQKTGVQQLIKDSKVDAHWIPLGCDPGLKKIDVPKKYDIGFVGRNADKYDRGRHLPLLQKRFPDSYIGQAPSPKIAEIYSSSKIGFNSSILNDVNMRIFEIPACGCFLLTNRIANDGLYEIFEEGKHFVTYTSDQDLIQKAEYYLNHEQEREKIAQAGYERVWKDLTYFHSLQKMFNYIAFKYGGEFNSLRL